MTAATDETVSRVQSRDGTEIGYWTTGAGPALVLVHGTLGDHTRWAVLLPHRESRFTVHAMDRRGRGASGDHDRLRRRSGAPRTWPQWSTRSPRSRTPQF